MFTSRADRRKFRHILARGFSHQSMASACKSFSGGNLPQNIGAVLGPGAIPRDLQAVATVFVKLQDERHRADYNLALPFKRSEVRALLVELDNAFQAWQRIRNEEMARFFLMSLPLWDQLRR